MPLMRSVIDPAPEPSGSTLYSPLSFLVGSDQPESYTNTKFVGRESGQLSGDLESVEESGTEYSARGVLSAQAEGDGVRMVLSTNDPSGRTLTVTVSPQETASGELIRVGGLPQRSAGRGRDVRLLRVVGG